MEYVNNKKLTDEVTRCKETGVLSRTAVDMFIKIAHRANRKLEYTDYRDKEDCIQSALLDMVKYWKNFKPEVSSNAFAFFTQIAKNGYAKEFKKIRQDVVFISLDHGGDNEIYTI